jgi:hypothetical protein
MGEVVAEPGVGLASFLQRESGQGMVKEVAPDRCQS